MKVCISEAVLSLPRSRVVSSENYKFNRPDPGADDGDASVRMLLRHLLMSYFVDFWITKKTDTLTTCRLSMLVHRRKISGVH